MSTHHHYHDHAHPDGSPLALALTLTLVFAVIEALGGWWAGSLALLSDAGHMLSDTASLGLAAFAARLARRPPSHRHSYGLVRAEVIAAGINGLLMLGVILFIVVEAVQRLQNPQPVAGGGVMAIAALGLAVNLLVAYVLSRASASMNIRAAMLHVMGDMLGSVAALVAGAVVYFTGWTPIDPLLSIFVAALILVSTWQLLREALHVLMEGVPMGLDLQTVGWEMARVDGVLAVHDLHIWQLATGKIALSAHLELDSLERWNAILGAMRAMLHERFDIDHVTLQPELRVVIEQPYKADIPIHQK